MVKHNIPFDVAFALDAEMRTAFCIRLGMMEGNEFDFENNKWKPRKGE